MKTLMRIRISYVRATLLKPYEEKLSHALCNNQIIDLLIPFHTGATTDALTASAQ